MARKLINYDEWLRTRSLVEARARRILSFFDVAALKRRRTRKGGEDARSGGRRRQD